MKNLCLFAAVLSLAFLVACGGGGPANPGTGAAGFTNASFSGNYVFTVNGQCVSVCNSTGVFEGVGVMTADGNGNITSGTWDVNVGGAYNGSPISFTGVYAVKTDGTANVTLTDSANSYSFVFMLSDPSGGYIVSAGSAWALAGRLERQSSSAMAQQPSGNYVFRTSGLTSGSHAWGVVGAMNFGTGAVTADTNEGTTISLLQTGSLVAGTFDTTKGRGTLNIVPSGGNPLVSMGYVYYVVDNSTLELVSSDASLGLQGRAESTTGVVPSGLLSGSYAFLASGFPDTGVAQVSEGGIFTGDGSGNVTSGVIDTVFDSLGQTGVTLTGSGSVSSVGGVTRDVLTLSPGTAPSVSPMRNAVLWMTSASRGFFLTTQSDRAETGTINVQSGAPYTDNGTFASALSGWALPSTGGAEGLAYATLFKNSNGTISGYTQVLNFFGSAGSNTDKGALSFDSTGTIGSLVLNNTQQNGTEDLRFYQYSPSSAFIMQADQGVVATGLMTVQTSQ